MREKTIHWKYLYGILIAGLLVAIISIPMVYTKIMVNTFNDYPDHIAFSKAIETGADIPIHIAVRPLWQLFVYGVRMILGVSYEWSAVLVASVVAIVTGMIISAILMNTCPNRKCLVSSVLFSVLLSIAAPIALFAADDNLHYLGYIGVNTYHNPTINLLKPIALVNLAFAVLFVKSKQTSPLLIVISALFTALSAFVKPNYLICLLPVLGLYTMYFYFTKQPIKWKLLLFGFFLPGVVIMAGQYLTAYAPNEPGIIFSPFSVMQYYSNNLLLKFLLSIFFPLVITIFYRKKIKNDGAVILSWMCFIIGALYTYLLAEEGVRFIHGNFGWSGEIALFLLFVAVTRFWLKNYFETKDDKIKNLIILFVSFTPHVVSGIIYYYYSITQNTFF